MHIRSHLQLPVTPLLVDVHDIKRNAMDITPNLKKNKSAKARTRECKQDSRIVQMVVIDLGANGSIRRIGRVIILPINIHKAARHQSQITL